MFGQNHLSVACSALFAQLQPAGALAPWNKLAMCSAEWRKRKILALRFRSRRSDGWKRSSWSGRGRDAHSQELASNSRPFVLCGLPIRCPLPGSLKHTRRNGRFTLEIVGHPDFGLPYGQDRLIPLWLATLAVRQRSRMVLFDSGAEILRTFGLPVDGVHYRRLVAGFKRIFASTIYFGDNEASRLPVWDCRRFHLFDRPKIWCSGWPPYGAWRTTLVAWISTCGRPGDASMPSELSRCRCLDPQA